MSRCLRQFDSASHPYFWEEKLKQGPRAPLKNQRTGHPASLSGIFCLGCRSRRPIRRLSTWTLCSRIWAQMVIMSCLSALHGRLHLVFSSGNPVNTWFSKPLLTPSFPWRWPCTLPLVFMWHTHVDVLILLYNCLLDCGPSWCLQLRLCISQAWHIVSTQ